MRVIETFVTSVPREKIPADAEWFVQGPVTGTPLSIAGSRAPIRVATGWSGFGRVYQHKPQQLAVDAAETVVTREELMRAYDLVEQGYTLWFGGECPVAKGTLVDLISQGGNAAHNGVVCNVVYWGSSTGIIAYRRSRKDVASDLCPPVGVSVSNKSMSQVETYETPLVELDHADTIVATAIEARLTHYKSDKWPGKSDNFCMKLSDGTGSWDADDIVIITRAQWDDYFSRKIRVGDKVKTPAGNEVEVLFVTDKTALVRYPKGAETSMALEKLTRLSQ